ncbi:large secreted protein [Rhodococcus phenolicus]|uniref:large secreted protein n=1 Tax=Rhodococcus phenolicus TaxID=263849 RepID=UPI00082B7269|nr:large secreted protein [Rhodococcus phenolicus]
MRLPTIVTRALTVAVFGCAAVACGNGAADVPPLPQAPAPAGATVFTARPDLLDPHPVEITSWSPAGDHIAVHFESGTPECYGVDATVTETGSSVTVALRGGTLPEAADRMCIQIAVTGILDVPLQSPLAGRTVTAG